MMTFVPLAMFATPVFYRVTDLPDPLRALAYANPLGTAIEMMRAAVLDGVLPPTLACCGFLFVSLAVCRGGCVVFVRYKGIFIEVFFRRGPRSRPVPGLSTLLPRPPPSKNT